ncbi:MULTISPECIES: SDR family oxidoreductase [unclassified Nocardioides]|uniref:SDR family oxidoreductase n=1 Tax=unclassified Nocardioides TaxID=2615069 RepID=UPI0006F76F40|nr:MULTISPECIES: SDR family oxidoreductase [unclassified Nocardioides]KQY64825.1 short-chain dehydrogenase [Nocardioides sp. Root140]KRF16420.1 short-chain dehydrogenase [Nocardioides sp. Soil796]
MPVALITGASLGLGHALARELSEQGWTLVLDARHAAALEAATHSLAGTGHVAVAGDVADPRHRTSLVEAVEAAGGLDLLVNNASTLGTSPLPRFADLEEATFSRILEVNLVAPLALTRALLPTLRARRGTVVNITSDAAVEAYEGWGGYGSAKAGLEHASRILAAEEPDLRVLAVDPGDMRTAMHQAAFPGEDISDRPLPDSVAPRLVSLVLGDAPSGRHQLAVEVPA